MQEQHLKRGNLLWESSRMFLPEHREQLLEKRQQQIMHSKPNLDADQLALIAQVISESLHAKSEITLTVYNSISDRQITGYVVRVDPHHGRILVQSESGDEWVKWGALIGAEREESP